MNIKKIFTKPGVYFNKLKKYCIKLIPDSIYIKFDYKSATGKNLNIISPKTFCEKLQWLKLYNRKKIYTLMADKYRVKEYIKEKIGEEYVIGLIGVYDNAKDINFDILPKKCVLKCNHDTASVIILDKSKNNDYNKIIEKLNRSLKSNFYIEHREWVYKNIDPKIIIEEYIGNNIEDYKFYCFNGEVKFLYISSGLVEDNSLELEFFDLNLNQVPFYRKEHPKLSYKPNKPKKFNEMIEASKILSKDIPFVRVDFMVSDDNVYFGELTFYPGCGNRPFYPEEYELKFGNMINIENVK